MTLYHGGAILELPENVTRLWASEDFDYAAAFAQLQFADVWTLSVDLAPSDVLDLASHRFDVPAVLAALKDAGIKAMKAADPHLVVRALADDAIRKAGHRAVRVLERVDWGAGESQTISFLIVDRTAIRRRRARRVPETGTNYQSIAKRVS